MQKRSKLIRLYNKEKIELVNPETLKLWSKYKIDMEIRALSEKTITQYNSDLSQWFMYIYEHQFNISVKEITEDDIEEFIYYTQKQGNNTNRIKRRMSTISAFYKFLIKKRIIKENPMMFIERPKNKLPIVTQTYLTTEQINEIRDKLTGNLQLKTYALFSLSTMARVNAIAHLRWDQINFNDRICEDVLEKEQKYVTLYFSEEVGELLKELKSERIKKNINDYGWVWRTPYVNEETPISNGTLSSWCNKIGILINVPTLHPHDFRHSGATLLKDKGMALEDVSSLLNHNSTDVTKKFYIKENKKAIGQLKDKYGI